MSDEKHGGDRTQKYCKNNVYIMKKTEATHTNSVKDE